MSRKKKGFFSIFLLLFLSSFVFLLYEENLNKPNTSDFIIISLLNTKKESQKISIDQIIKNELKKTETDPFKLKENINNKIINYNSKNKILFLKNKISKKTKSLTKTELDLITQAIVFSPSKHTTIKQYFINNGITQETQLYLKITNNIINTTYDFPKDYKIEVVSYN